MSAVYLHGNGIRNVTLL